MIRTIKVELNAAFPNMPLAPFNVFHNSAAAVTVLNVPRRIVSLSLKVKNVSGAEQAFAAQRNGSSWGVVIPANFLAQSGTSTKGVKIVGVDDAANAFTLGAADLVVLLDDGTVTPVEEGGDMKHSEFSDLVAPDDMTQKESNALLKTIVNKLKGTALLLLCACCLPALAVPLSPDMDFGDISPTNKLGEVVKSGGAITSIAPALDYTTAVSNKLESGKQDKISDLAAIRAGAAAGATAYQKPSGGIPKSDLAAGVQTSLGKADTALQSFEEQDPTVGLTNGTIHIKGQTITPLTSFTEQDPTATAKANAAIAAAGCVRTNEQGEVLYSVDRLVFPRQTEFKETVSVDNFIDFYSGSDYIGGIYGDESGAIYSSAAFSADYIVNRSGIIEVLSGGHNFYLPYTYLYDEADSEYKIATVSQIEAATNAIAQTIPQKINAAVSANLNTYIDGETGVEYVGKFYGGSLYYVPTGNVYPPNN